MTTTTIGPGRPLPDGPRAARGLPGLPDPSTAVAVEGLQVRYGRTAALRGLDLAVPANRITALLGPNGAGKSTLLTVLSTLRRPDAGRVRVFGHDVRADPAAVRGCLGMVFQERTLDKELSVRANLSFHAGLFGLGRRQARERIDELLHTCGLDHVRDQPVERLSGGTARRVEVLRARLHRPRLLLLDEPTAGLDPDSRHQLWRDLTRLRDESGLSVLYCTHYLEEAELADDVAVVVDGRVVARGGVEELVRDLNRAQLLLEAAEPAECEARLRAAGFDVRREGNGLRVPCTDPEGLVPAVVAAAGDGLLRVGVDRPALQDVYRAVVEEAP